MGIEVASLSELDDTQVQQTYETIKTLTAELHPTLDLKRGVFTDIVVLPAAQHTVAKQEEIDRLRRSNSIKTISEDPTLADDDAVNNVISNARMTRRQGNQATGEITIVVSQLATVTVANGATFEANGSVFNTVASYVARTSAANVQSDTDRVLTQTAEGNYSFTVDVTAAEEGSASLLSQGTKLTATTSISNLVSVFAASDFLNGDNEETNAELVERYNEGLATKALSNRVNMSAMLRENFPEVISESAIGYGDAEMSRDQRSVLPISFGGRVDWYVRTRELPQALQITVTATLIEKTNDSKGRWQFGVGRDIAPGFYDIVSVAPKDATEFLGSFEVTADTRSIDSTAIAGELLPDVDGVDEGAFSRFQATVVQFLDTETDTAALTVSSSTQEYSVVLKAMPAISNIQTKVGSRDHRNYAGDVLVRAAIPCYVSIAFTLQAKAGEVVPDAFTIKNDVASYINNLGFTGRLHASNISDIIHNNITGHVSVSAIDLHGQLLRPSGTIKRLRSSEVLLIPDESGNMVSARTVIFVCDPDDIQISAQTVNIPV